MSAEKSEKNDKIGLWLERKGEETKQAIEAYLGRKIDLDELMARVKQIESAHEHNRPGNNYT